MFFIFLQDLGKKKLAKKVLVKKRKIERKNVIEFVGNTPILAN
jgi:hypothetical protein